MLLNLLKPDVTANYFFTRPLSDYAHSRAFSLIYLVYMLVGRWKEGRKDAKPNEQSEARKEVVAKQGCIDYDRTKAGGAAEDSACFCLHAHL